MVNARHHFTGPPELVAAFSARLAAFDRDRIVHRIWAKDHTVWKPDPTEIVDRLGWLDVGERLRTDLVSLAGRFQADLDAEEDGLRFEHIVLLGMGGSSLAPEVLFATFGPQPGKPSLLVLDSTSPAEIAAVEARIDIDRTLFIVSSKSGGTIETRSQFAYFWNRKPDGRHFVVITDAGSPLDAMAVRMGVRMILRNPSDIGGRYSALSYFGMAPAALLGLDVERLLDRAREMTDACRAESAAENPGAWLGALIGEASLLGRDKLTFVLPPALATLGTWLEQLIAESTGKEGCGIVPVEGEALGALNAYGGDRLFVALWDDPRLDGLEAAGQPVVRIAADSAPETLGAEFFRWEFATAAACHVLGVHPFDQPHVQGAKDATARILGGREPAANSMSLAEALDSIRAGDYLAITAYLPRNAGTVERLDRVRLRLRDSRTVATTVGFGPRFLHSTGQLHKGGANNVVVLQVVEPDARDLAIPGEGFTFGRLREAQSLGDLESLRAEGRRVWRGPLAELEAAVNGEASSDTQRVLR